MNKKYINIILSAIFVILFIFFSFVIFGNYKENINDSESSSEGQNKKILNKNSEIKITIGGDVMLSRVVGHFNQKEGFDRITKKFNPISQTGGLVILNLESPFSKNDKDGFHSSYYFGAHTGSIETLKSLKGKNKMILSLANNHIRNSLKEGFDTTMDLLKKNDILYSGIGINIKNSEKISEIKINKNLVCLQAFSYDGGKYGNMYINKISEKSIKKSLDKMKEKNCNLNLISLHWGREYRFEPSKEQVKLAHYIIDNGADMIIGHHSHIFGKTEIYKEKPIFYSLGNYIFDQDGIVDNCEKGKDCIYDEKLKKKILPVQIGVSYELIFENKKVISSIQKKHRMVNYGELIKY